jgi:3-oxoacyl-[acyl-carrier-protein] synthase III
MKYQNVKIDSFAYELPNKFISSDEIENELAPVYKRLRLPEGRLELQTGIKTRGYWEAGTRPSQIATNAARKLFEKTDIKRDEIDLLIFSSVCRDFLEPSTASVVHHNLELPKSCQNFDLSNACLGVLNAMSLAANMIETGQIRNALIVSGENGGPLLKETIKHLNENTELTRKSIKKYIASLTIGSAGVALLLSHKDRSNSKHEFLGSSYLADTSTNHLCQGDGNTNTLMMETDSEALLHAGINLATENWEKTKSELDWTNENVDKVICHQVGVAHRNLMLESLKLDRSKDFSTFEKLGNTGSAALPITLMMAHENKFLLEGDKVAGLGIGSGLNSIMVGIKW